MNLLEVNGMKEIQKIKKVFYIYNTTNCPKVAHSLYIRLLNHNHVCYQGLYLPTNNILAIINLSVSCLACSNSVRAFFRNTSVDTY